MKKSFARKPQTLTYSVERMFFKCNSIFMSLTFQIIYLTFQIIYYEVRVNIRKYELKTIFETS